MAKQQSDPPRGRGRGRGGGAPRSAERQSHTGKIPSHKHSNNEKKRTPKFKPRTMEEYHSVIRTDESSIKNKQKRQEVHFKRSLLKNTIRSRERRERKKLPQRQTPITIEDKQVPLEHEAQYEQALFDEFNSILNQEHPVKILITTCIRPAVKIYPVLRELMMVFHNVAFYPRRNLELPEVYQYARQLSYTHVMVVRYSAGWELLVKHLNGLQAVFKLSSLTFQEDIRNHAVATDHIPELILNNFDSKVGIRVGRLLASLFPQQPEFKGRRVVTFHNQRDFIFFRHHRYIFKEGYEGVAMQQIGPRFTLKVKNVSSDHGVEFNALNNMYVDRKAVYL